MTIREYVLNSKTQGINDWLAQIENDKMQKHESIIISCADYYGKITASDIPLEKLLRDSINYR